MNNHQISLEGLPEPMIRAIEVMVQSAREISKSRSQESECQVGLPVWQLGLKEPLRREDYYDDVA